MEAVIDKDLCSALLAIGLGAEVLVLATDVEAVYLDWGGTGERAIAGTTPAELRGLDLPAGSMGPKVEAAAASPRRPEVAPRSAPSRELSELLDGTRGTQVRVHDTKEDG